jgi:hypothetical protein
VGYTSTLRYINFELTLSQQNTICDYLRSTGFSVNKGYMTGGSYNSNNERREAWYVYADMDDLKWGIETGDLVAVFDCFGYSASFAREGTTITDLSYHGDTGDSGWLFNAIAEALPELEGYIEWAGEEGDRYRWVIKGGVVTETYPRLVWDDGEIE